MKECLGARPGPKGCSMRMRVPLCLLAQLAIPKLVQRPVWPALGVKVEGAVHVARLHMHRRLSSLWWGARSAAHWPVGGQPCMGQRAWYSRVDRRSNCSGLSWKLTASRFSWMRSGAVALGITLHAPLGDWCCSGQQPVRSQGCRQPPQPSPVPPLDAPLEQHLQQPR